MMVPMDKLLVRITLLVLLVLKPALTLATLVEPQLFDFTLTPHYNDPNYWASKDSNGLTVSLMTPTAQLQQFRRFKTKWFAPWDESTIQRVTKDERYPTLLKSLNNRFRNDIQYAITCSKTANCKAPLMQSNFRPFTNEWFADIERNVDVQQFEKLRYDPNHRAIIIHNSLVRVFPVHDPYYEREKNVGLIHPFDRLQMSTVWAGTPVYILGTTQDQAWHYIYTHSFSGWVPAQHVNPVDDDFIEEWQRNNSELIAVMKNDTSLINNANRRFITQIGIGAVLPGEKSGDTMIVDVPIIDKQGQTHIVHATLKNTDNAITALPVPIPATRENFAYLLQDMVNKPYGWGGTSFYHDCSQELKNLYAPFGIWLARNSRAQMDNVRVVKLDDQRSLNQRLNYLRNNGKPFLTLVYVGGHIMLYVGEDDNNMPVFYQNVWYVWKKDEPNVQVIGQSLFLPADVKASNTYSLLDADASDYFWVGFLDEPI